MNLFKLLFAREEKRKEKIKKRMQLADLNTAEEREKKKLKWVYCWYYKDEFHSCIIFRKKKKEEARKAELAFSADAEEDCSASNPKCKRPTGKQVCFRQIWDPLNLDNSTETE